MEISELENKYNEQSKYCCFLEKEKVGLQKQIEEMERKCKEHESKCKSLEKENFYLTGKVEAYENVFERMYGKE